MARKASVFRVRLGYNPNSSSVGTWLVPFFLWPIFAFAVNLVLGLVGAALLWRRRRT